MQPESLQEARDWLNRAERDLKVAARILVGEETFPDLAAFHAQQAAEKALKGFLAAHNQPLVRTHDLELLVDRCVEIEPALSQFLEAARTLASYAVASRYPGGLSEPSDAEAHEAIGIAEAVVRFVTANIPLPGRD